MSKNIGILGAGAWGSTLSSLLTSKKCSVTLWEFDAKRTHDLKLFRTLSFFPNLTIPKNVNITNDLKEAIQNKDFIIFALPSHTVREVAKKVSASKINLSNTMLISVTKGIENLSLKRMSEVISEELPKFKENIVALSGPTIAEEVVKKQPTIATAVSLNEKAAKSCQELFMTPYFRIYTHNDIIGVETGGSLKNIFAIAAGICDGLGFGDNTKAALISRGLRELVSLGTKMGGQPSTYFGLTGLGDLIVTCFSKHSRNRTLGEKIGKGKSLNQSEKELIMVAEGVKTTESAYALAKHFNLELPIIQQVYQILFEKKSPNKALEELMLREAKPEIELDPRIVMDI